MLGAVCPKVGTSKFGNVWSKGLAVGGTKKKILVFLVNEGHDHSKFLHAQRQSFLGFAACCVCGWARLAHLKQDHDRSKLLRSKL